MPAAQALPLPSFHILRVFPIALQTGKTLWTAAATEVRPACCAAPCCGSLPCRAVPPRCHAPPPAPAATSPTLSSAGIYPKEDHVRFISRFVSPSVSSYFVMNNLRNNCRSTGAVRGFPPQLLHPLPPTPPPLLALHFQVGAEPAACRRSAKLSASPHLTAPLFADPLRQRCAGWRPWAPTGSSSSGRCLTTCA